MSSFEVKSAESYAYIAVIFVNSTFFFDVFTRCFIRDKAVVKRISWNKRTYGFLRPSEMLVGFFIEEATGYTFRSLQTR